MSGWSVLRVFYALSKECPFYGTVILFSILYRNPQKVSRYFSTAFAVEYIYIYRVCQKNHISPHGAAMCFVEFLFLFSVTNDRTTGTRCIFNIDKQTY